MALLRLLSAVEQVAAYVREELLRGHWSGFLPGVDRLAAELGVSRKTVEAALRQLEAEGFLLRQGPRRKRIIGCGATCPGPRCGWRSWSVRRPTAGWITWWIFCIELVEAGHTVSLPQAPWSNSGWM